jgi:glycosyl-4,4'-diaponeurosporenoate acyltransferase
MAAPTTWWVVLSSAGFWLLVSLVVGLLANRLPERWLERRPDHPPPRLAAAPGIRRWKRWIPDAGPALPGGIAKANLVSRDPLTLQRLVVETRRAELVHWTLWAAALLTPLWLPPAAALGNLLFATGFNLPCLLLQRFNQRRLLRCLARVQGPRFRSGSESSTARPGSSA